MHTRRNGWIGGLLIACLVCLNAGCSSKGPTGPERVPTFPVKGQVLVDGAPAGSLQVILNPNGTPPVPTLISAMTDAEGKFTIGTYESNDGAPAGEYKATFEWKPLNMMTGRYEGSDKLNDRYKEPAKSEVSVSVTEGSDTDLGEIKLTTK